MFEDDEDAGSTAIAYTNDFVEAAIAKLDAAFGDGYAKDNPAALAGYVAACANNLNAFMTAATAMPDDLMAALEALEEEPMPPAPARGKGKGRR